MSLSLVILAAGMGSRYGGNKQIDVVGTAGEWMMDYAIYDAYQSGFSEVVLITQQEMIPLLQEHLQPRWGHALHIVYVVQTLPKGGHADRKKPWGTGQALLCAEKVLKNPFLLINADDFYGREAYNDMQENLSALSLQDPTCFLVGYTLQHTLSKAGSVSRGICQMLPSTNHLQSITEHTKLKGKEGKVYNYAEGKEVVVHADSLVSMNFWGFTLNIFRSLHTQWEVFYAQHAQHLTEEFYLPSVASYSMQKKEHVVKVLQVSQAYWMGITYKEEKNSIQETLRQYTEQKLYPSPVGAVPVA